MSHTPGPWLVTDNFGEGQRLHMVWGHGVLVARTCFAPASVDNARLIAAAPELYAALSMVRDADDDCRKDGLPAIPSEARARIDSAIAKAEV